MAQLIKKMPSLSNVASGQTCTLQLPIGLTYDCVQLVHNAANLAHASNVRVIVDGKDIMTFKDFAEIKLLNDYYGRLEQTGITTIWFTHPEMSDLTNRRAPALGTSDVSTLVIQFDINASWASPSVTAYALQSPPDVSGLITKIKAYNATFGASGKVDIDNIVKAGRIKAMHLFKSDITACDVEVNGRLIHESVSALNQAVQKQYGRTPQTGMYTIDFANEGEILAALITDGIFDFRVRPTIGTSGAVRILVEYLDAFAGI